MLKSFSYHRPSAAGVEKIASLRQAFSDLAELIERLVPPSRERSIAITNLETSAMWAIKSIVVNDSGSVVEGDAAPRGQ
jgi:hypothetical protein